MCSSPLQLFLGVHPFSTYAKLSCAFHGVRYISFAENFTYILNGLYLGPFASLLGVDLSFNSPLVHTIGLGTLPNKFLKCFLTLPLRIIQSSHFD